MKITLPDPCLVILCGPAACGKTTFARRHFKSTQIVSSDHCRAMLTDSEAAIWASPQAFELFHDIIRTRLRFNRLTVADSTALGKPARAELRRLARNTGMPAVLIVFNVANATCLARDASRRRQVGEFIVADHIRKLHAAITDIRTERYEAVYVLDENEMDDVRIRRPRKRRTNTEHRMDE